MNYYEDYKQIYLIILFNKYRDSSPQNRELIKQEIYDNKNLRRFQQNEIWEIVSGKRKFPRIEKDKLFITYS